MADDVTTVHTWLQGTLLPDATQRQAAEEALEAAAAVPAHVVCLFRLCADPAVPAAPEYRQAAAVRMKNLITKRWEAPSDRAIRVALLPGKCTQGTRLKNKSP